MAGKKVYAVKKGKITGVFKSWDECRASVDGYPGAEYKGFPTEKEAREYLSGIKEEVADAFSEEKGEPGQLIAYVDGSFDAEIGKYAFGCVMIRPDGEIVRESGNGNNPESVALRNVTGEMLGAMFAVKWCDKNGYSAVRICYDYMGIEMWATGQWRAKNDLTRKYARFMQEHGRRLRITFQKIAAHTGNRYNEEADRLARKALVEGNGIPPVRKVVEE